MRNVPSPSESSSSKVRFFGRCRLATPCRIAKGRVAGTNFRVSNTRPFAVPANAAHTTSKHSTELSPNRKCLTNRAAQAAQDCHRSQLFFDVNMNRARDAHAAQQQRDESDQVQKMIKIVHRPTQLALAVFHCLMAKAQLIELWCDSFDQ